LGASCSDSACPFRQSLGGAGWFAPGLPPLGTESLRPFDGDVVFGAGFASAEPARCGEATLGGGLVCDGIDVGGTVCLGLHRQRLGDLGAYLCGGVLGSSEHSGAVLVLGLVGSALGVEPGGGLLPSFRRLFCTLGLV